MRARRFAELALFRSGVAVDADDKARTLAEVERVAARVGARSRSVLLSEPDPLRFALAFFALLDHGHTPIVLPPDLNAFQRAHVRASFGAAFTWAPTAEGELLAPADDRAEADANAVPDAYGCMTSGTLGPPALWLLGVDGATANARAHAASLELSAEHTLLQSLPLHHSFGIACYLFTALELGCALDFSPAFLTFRTLKKRAPLARAVLYTSPAQVRFLLREGEDAPPGLDVLTVGAGVCDPRELAELRARLRDAKLFVTYGLTEAGPRVTTGRITSAAIAHGYVGRALPGVELSVRTASGELRRAGQGQLCVRSLSLAKNLTPPLVTRDEVVLAEDGDVVFLSRMNDLVKVGGISVYPQEVEAVARLHPGVVDCLVVKRPDPIYEEVFDLVVEGTAPELEPALRAFLQERLGSHQWPKRIVVMRELPRSALGKIDRKRVADKMAGS